jgi:hypothetical protein
MPEKIGEKKSDEISTQQPTTPISPVNVIIQLPQPKRRAGKQRSIFAPLLLPIVTLGIYFLVWLYKIYTEADFYCDKKVNITSGAAAVGFLFIPVFQVIWSIMLWFKTPGLLTKMQIADGIPENQIKHYGHYGWLNFIPIIGTIFWIVLIQSAFNQYWAKVLTGQQEL